jgi:2,5-diketo-D-gluconate reductase A
MATQPIIKLHDGNKMPQLGLGVWKASNEEASNAVTTAIDTGYRHIDTAAIYENEEGVGEALSTISVPR